MVDLVGLRGEGDARQQAAGMSADSLQEIRARADRVLAYEFRYRDVVQDDDGNPIDLGERVTTYPKTARELARDVVTLTESCGLLLVRLQDAEDQRDEMRRAWQEAFAEVGRLRRAYELLRKSSCR